MRLLPLLASLSILAGCATPQASVPTASTMSPETHERGMVSAADPRAAAAGAEILRKGGSASDAAFATLLALTVVEPQSSGIGGGGYLVYSDRGGPSVTYDGRETAPAAATGTWFFKNGEPMEFSDAQPGGKSVGVPGNVMLMWIAHMQHGKLPWTALFQPAIRLARDGFRITPRMNRSLDEHRATGALSAQARALFYGPDGRAKPAGTLVRNPALADYLQYLSSPDPERFYRGANAQAIVSTVNGAEHNPSQMQLSDLAGYRAKSQPPVCGKYRGYRICGMGPSSSGGTTVFATLKQLERFDLSALGPRSAVAWHLIADSMRLAYSDRDLYLADEAFVPVPVAGLMDPRYLAMRSALLSPIKALEQVHAGIPPEAPAPCRPAIAAEHGTSHFVAVDRWGDVASETSTVESAFGSGLMVEGYYLNNELTDFSFVPERAGCPVANRVQGGKRPRSSMSPTIVYGPDGHIRLAVGAAGGATIPAQVLRVIIGVIDWHLTAQQAIDLPMLFAPGDTVYVEKGTYLEALAPQLRAIGHTVELQPSSTYKANAIEWTGAGWAGAADPRSEGAVVAE